MFSLRVVFLFHPIPKDFRYGFGPKKVKLLPDSNITTPKWIAIPMFHTSFIQQRFVGTFGTQKESDGFKMDFDPHPTPPENPEQSMNTQNP